MELGATVCTPRAPDCPRCPIRPVCRGKDEPAKFPAARKRPVRPLLEWRALALTRKDGAVLLARRPAEALFGGLWDLPVERPEGIRILGRMTSLGVVEQTLTHREVRVTLQTARERHAEEPSRPLGRTRPNRRARRVFSCAQDALTGARLDAAEPAVGRAVPRGG